MRRREAARLLSISETTLRRRYEGKALPVEVDASGVHVFSLVEVEAFARELRVVTVEDAPPPADECEVYAQLFERFDAGEHPLDVVTKLRSVNPDLVEKAHAQWARMREGLVLDRDHVRSLRRLASVLPHRSFAALRSAADVVALMQAVVEAPPPRKPCLLCAKRAATVCSSCLGREQNAVRRTQLTHERDMRKMDLDAEKQRAQWARDAAESARQHEREQQRAHERHLAELAVQQARVSGK